MRHFLFILILAFVSPTVHAQDLNWRNMEAANEPLARHENALVAVGEKIVLIGGRGEKPVDIYDIKEKKWSQGAQPPLEMHHMQAVSLDGLVYILGGFTGSWPYETPLTHILIYDLKEDTWTIGSEIPHGRRRGAAGAVAHNGKIYLINGIINGHTSGWVNWLDEYDPYTGQWKILADAPVARDHFQAVVINDKLFVAGGRRSGSGETGFSGTVKETNVYDFKSNTWNTMADIPTPRAYRCSCL
ncbi:galactose oxidase [Antarcticibacterium sp. 1MA-6-2]|uniref:Kelch repeat-containing protein n=1 Tax=Antarcticibacterium sp. 1MA-6-2 TaxID=2908210 RepID=UPI001F1DBA16|nr:kelch repeat-containing protein [Antarcticibacterium sp. 1MA-6-2]UJH92612.1 galactose oxidase [Antarcticibacterium sp. 1MA-6-2]